MSQRILRLVSENVKRVKAIDLTIDPKQALVLVKGDNAAGKSSVLDSIAYILGGKRVQPPEVIRKGESYARGLLETEELIVERKWSTGDNGKLVDTIEVRSKEGAKFKSPQTMLDGLISRLSFDPLHFLALKPDEQAEALRKIVGLDFRTLDGQRLKAYVDRTLANRELLSLQKRLEVSPEIPGKLEAVDVAGLLADQAVAQGAASKRRELEHASTAAHGHRTNCQTLMKEAEAAMSKAFKRLADAQAAEKEANAALEAHPAPAPELVAQLATAIATASDQNDKVRRQAARAELVDQVAKAAAVAHALSSTIEGIDAEKKKKTETAPFPVPGLGFGDVGVTFKDLPFEQASGAERIRVSTGIGFALNPELKVLRIKDGSLLDSKSLALLEELAKEANGQIWLEIVGKGGVGIVIEDGSVESIDGVAPVAVTG